MSLENFRTPYLTIAEVAEALRGSKVTVYRLVRAHALASVRFGNSYRIPEAAIEDYIRMAADPAES